MTTYLPDVSVVACEWSWTPLDVQQISKVGSDVIPAFERALVFVLCGLSRAAGLQAYPHLQPERGIRPNC